MFAIVATESPAPVAVVVAGNGGGKTFGYDRAAAAQLRSGVGLIGARRGVGPFQDPPLCGDAEPTHHQGSVLEDDQVD